MKKFKITKNKFNNNIIMFNKDQRFKIRKKLKNKIYFFFKNFKIKLKTIND